MKRRKAIAHTAAGLGGMTLIPHFLAEPFSAAHRDMGIDFGVQLFTVPSLVDKDLKSALSAMARIGYREVEFFGPYPFSAEETKVQWAGLKSQLGLKNDAFYGYTPSETGQILEDLGLKAPSFHTDLLTLRLNLGAMLDELASMQPRYLVLPAVFENRETISDYQRLAAEFNRIGEKMSPYDMQFVYHNHGYEHAEMEGKMPMDVLLEETDPRYVSFELDIFWMQAAGANPISYLKRFPGRYKLLHIKDASEPFRFAGDGSTPDQWMAGFSVMADPGDGVYDIPGILEAAHQSGVTHYFLERDLAPEPLSTLTNSFSNLTSML